HTPILFLITKKLPEWKILHWLALVHWDIEQQVQSVRLSQSGKYTFAQLDCHGFRPIAADQKYATAVYFFRYDFEAAFYAVHLRLPSRLNRREIPAFRVACNISVRHSPCKTVLWHCASATGQMAHDRNPTLLVK